MGFPPGVQRADMGPIGFLRAPLPEELETVGPGGGVRG